MKKFILSFGLISILVSFIFSSVAMSAALERVTLLISVSHLEQKQLQEMNEIIAKDFHEKFGSQFETRAIFQADQADLFSALNDSHNVGVFWVSHANSGLGFAGTDLDGRIVDSKGIDISDLFKSIHPELKWLGVIGCKTLPIFQKNIVDHLYDDREVKLYDTTTTLAGFFNPEPLSANFNGMIIAASSTSVFATLNAEKNFSLATDYLNNQADIHPMNTKNAVNAKKIGSNNHKNVFNLTIIRSPELDRNDLMESVKIILKGQVIYVFPLSNQTETVNLRVDLSRFKLDLENNKNDISFVVDSGLSVNQKTSDFKNPHLGQFTFVSTELKREWKLVTIQGKALGINQHIYKAK